MSRHPVVLTLASALVLAACASTDAANPAGTPGVEASGAELPQSGDPYFVDAAAGLQARAERIGSSAKGRPARNVILFIGDGMGVATVTAARIRAGQKVGGDGESFDLTMDAFPHVALSRTYAHDAQTSDSAATATAMVTGVKTRAGMLGVTAAVERDDCAASQVARATTMFELAEAAGKATGIVSTARITHATPAAAYAHSASRDWENDAVLPAAAAEAGCVDIARQLVEWPAGDGFEIALGGGRANFLPADAVDPEDAAARGARTDGRDLTKAWAAKSNRHVVAHTKAELDAADLAGGAKVLGLFERSHMQYEADRAKDKGGEPSLAEMTKTAISRLSQNDDGYVLMVEAGRIDHGHHAGNAYRALEDTIAFDAAIKAALDATRRDDTLIVVTADHSHTLVIQGYSKRNNSILGVANYAVEGPAGAADGKPYTTLSYANGPGAATTAVGGARKDLSAVDTTAADFQQQALIPLESETHAGEDVAAYAWGPGAALVSGTMEQNMLFHVMATSAGLID